MRDGIPDLSPAIRTEHLRADDVRIADNSARIDEMSDVPAGQLFPIECQRIHVFGTQVVEQERSVTGIEAQPLAHPSSVREASQVDHPLGSAPFYRDSGNVSARIDKVDELTTSRPGREMCW